MVEFVQRETAILKKISHPNIVRLYDVARTNNYLYMFLEYCADGDLKDYMTKKEEKRLREVILISYFSLKQSFSLNIL
jgi:serine/threonine-protein kinase ULK/ATG1